MRILNVVIVVIAAAYRRVVSVREGLNVNENGRGVLPTEGVKRTERQNIHHSPH